MNKENIFYVYLHRRTTDNKVFYVGKGKKKRAWDKTNRSDYWKYTESKHGIIVEVVFENLTEDEAFQAEKDTILEMRYFGHPLCNFTEGGEGTSGVKQSAETIAKRVKANTGKKRTDETKLKISLAQTGKKRTSEQIAQQSLRLKGTKRSLEAVVKTAKSNTGQRRSKEQLETMRLAGLVKAVKYDYSEKMGGMNNPAADQTLHTFVNIKTSEIFIGTRIQMCEKYNINPHTLRNLFSRNGRTAAGWKLIKENNDTNS